MKRDRYDRYEGEKIFVPGETHTHGMTLSRDNNVLLGQYECSVNIDQIVMADIVDDDLQIINTKCFAARLWTQKVTGEQKIHNTFIPIDDWLIAPTLQINPLTGDIGAYIEMIEENDAMFEIEEFIEGDRVLLVDQDNPSENGIYTVSSCQDRMVNSVDYNSFFGSELEQIVSEKATPFEKRPPATLLSPGINVWVTDECGSLWPSDVNKSKFDCARGALSDY